MTGTRHASGSPGEPGRAAVDAAGGCASGDGGEWDELSDAEFWELFGDADSGPDETRDGDLPGEALVEQLGAEAVAERRVPPRLALAFPAGTLPRGADAPRPVGDGLFPGFAAGGALDSLVPGPALGGFAEDAHEVGLSRLSDDELIGLVRAWRRLASWVTARELATVGELAARRFMQADAAGEGPDVAAASVEAELACALTLTARGAQVLVERAGELSRLPATASALASGAIDEYRARVIAGELSGLDETQARRVEARLVGKAPGQTSGQLRAAAHRAVLAADPQAAVRRRERAQREARVEVWAEPAGTAAMAGRDLPPAEVLAADKRIDALARRLKQQGAGASMDQLRARVYLSLLSGIPVHELTVEVAGRMAGQTGHADDDTPAQAGPPDGAGQGGTRPVPGTEIPGGGAALGLAGRINLTLPVATLLGLSAEPGEVPGFGPVDAPTAGSLAGAAAADPLTRWCLSVTDSDGRVVAHGCATHRPTPPPGRRRNTNCGDPGNDPDGGDPGSAPPGGGGSGCAGPGCGGHVPLPAGAMLFKLERLAARECDHERETAGYVPPVSLRHLIEVRDLTCSFPGCRRLARQCDLDHTVSYDRGGRTCECNLAPLCRFHHKIKQTQGWTLQQPQPGVMRWVTPSGRTYAVTNGRNIS
ncbi:MAG: DUF222 domain-containing protein [Micromonosporaceae bacterium]